MYFLIYLSFTQELYTDQQLSDILMKSRSKNESAGITGLLLYHEGNIIQVLEGEKEAVRKIYNVICSDSRHSGVIEMLQGDTETRNFPDWSMGFKHVSSNDWLPFAGYFKLERDGLSGKVKSKSLPILTVINSFMNVNVRS